MSTDNVTETVNENAAGGSTGAGAIASAPSRHGDKEWRAGIQKDKEDKASQAAHSAHVQSQLARAKEIKAAREKEKKRGSFASFFRRKVSEDFDMASVVSQLKGMEADTNDSASSVVSYGIEDDKGNFMRVTVRADQAKEFEMTIARKMADNKDNMELGLKDQKGSLAEILFDLQNQFEITDVEFPIIPKDAVYNAGEATVGTAPVGASDNTTAPTGGDDLLGGDMGDFDMDMSANAAGGSGDLGDDTLDDGTTDSLGGDMGMQDTELDGSNVEDFGDESTSDSDPSSLLKSLVDMLKKQAEAETAKANAAAEQSRATQAEWSAIAANKEVERQEELARVEADVQEKKRREKMARQYAEIAKYNVTQGKSALNQMGEDYELGNSFLDAALMEYASNGETYDNVNALQKAKQDVLQKYKVNPNDDQLTKNYKAAAQRLEVSIINNRIQLATLSDQYNKQQGQQQDQQNQQNQNQNQNQNQQQQQQQPQQGQPNQQQQGQQQQGQAPNNNGGI